MVLLDGRALAKEIRARVRREAQALRKATGVTPHLATVLVGNDPASEVYVRSKERAMERAGMAATVFRLPHETSWPELGSRIDALCADDSIHGILVQQPLPPQIDAAAVAVRTDPRKDVDGLHPLSAGHLLRGEDQGFVPCTPLGIMALLRHYEVPLRGARAVVVGRSTLVGKPLALLLLAADATVTICHSKTPDLAGITRQADVICMAAGRAGLLRPDMVRPGAAVVDVGMNRIPAPAADPVDPEDGEDAAAGATRLVGDADPAVAEVAGWYSPVPGGVGPLTIAMLLSNTLLSATRAAGGARHG